VVGDGVGNLLLLEQSSHIWLMTPFGPGECPMNNPQKHDVVHFLALFITIEASKSTVVTVKCELPCKTFGAIQGFGDLSRFQT
jgi:hypothetical protein